MTNSLKFKAMMIEDVDGKQKSALRDISVDDLPGHDVLVKVAYSSLNYKDGLALTGKGRIARRTPMVAGIDLSGTVVESRSPQWKPGDQVIVNGWGLSETEWGGYSHYQRIRPEFLTRLPQGFDLAQAMAIGTAGYTAALCLLALEDWGQIAKSDLPVLVTGAAGGVGSVAVALLARRGYQVTAVTGRAETHDYLRALGATALLPRETLADAKGALQKEQWSGAVDSVGAGTLANVLAQTSYGGAVAACGLAAGFDLPATVMPHILRSVALLGVDSVMAPQDKRDRAWALLAESLDTSLLAAMTSEHAMPALPKLAEDIIAGQIRGRVVIRMEH